MYKQYLTKKKVLPSLTNNLNLFNFIYVSNSRDVFNIFISFNLQIFISFVLLGYNL